MTWIAIAMAMAVALAGWRRAYNLGVRHGRWEQALDDRLDIEEAVIARARAEQLAQVWESRAKALLYAHFGPGGEP